MTAKVDASIFLLPQQIKSVEEPRSELIDRIELKRAGWNDSLIETYLGLPDVSSKNRMFHKWHATKVSAAASTPEVRLAMEQVLARRQIKNEAVRLAKIKAGDVYESARGLGYSKKESGKKAKTFFHSVFSK